MSCAFTARDEASIQRASPRLPQNKQYGFPFDNAIGDASEALSANTYDK